MMTQDEAPAGGCDPQRAWAGLLAACHGRAWRANGRVSGAAAPADVAGVASDMGAARLWRCYAPLARPPGERPRVVAQLGQSLDGRIATAHGHSHYVTGAADRVHLHRLRALSDAVLVGAGTLIADNPRLTVREIDGPQPARVVVAERDGLDAGLGVFCDGAAATWGVAPAGVNLPAVTRRLTAADGRPASVLAVLAQAGVRRLLVEGGARTVSAWLAAGLVDHLYIAVAPVIIGSGPVGLQLPAIRHMDEAWRPPFESFALGEDRLYRLDFSAGPA